MLIGTLNNHDCLYVADMESYDESNFQPDYQDDLTPSPGAPTLTPPARHVLASTYSTPPAAYSTPTSGSGAPPTLSQVHAQVLGSHRYLTPSRVTPPFTSSSPPAPLSFTSCSPPAPHSVISGPPLSPGVRFPRGRASVLHPPVPALMSLVIPPPEPREVRTVTVSPFPARARVPAAQSRQAESSSVSRSTVGRSFPSLSRVQPYHIPGTLLSTTSLGGLSAPASSTGSLSGRPSARSSRSFTGSRSRSARTARGHPQPPPRSAPRTCSVRACTTAFFGKGGHESRHALKCHLPWWLSAHTACWHCEQQFANGHALRHHLAFSEASHPPGAGFTTGRAHDWIYLFNGLLNVFCTALGLSDLWALLGYVREHHLYPSAERFAQLNQEDRELLMVYERTFTEHPPSDASKLCVFPPSGVSCLSHWRVLVSLLNVVPPHVHALVLGSAAKTALDGRPIPAPGPSMDYPVDDSQSLEFIDTHFHLDFTLRELGCRSFDQLEAAYSTADFTLLRAVSNFVFPNIAQNIMRTVPGHQTRVVYSVGFHPSAVQKFQPFPQSVARLVPHLLEPTCVGLGEVGIDLTKQAPQALQVAALRLLLPLARDHGKVLILHCRDSRASGQRAVRALLSLIQALHLTSLRIHFHCFSYPKSVAVQWLEACPRVHFGITACVLVDPDLAVVAAWLPRDRFLLETDAPFLAPRGVGFHRNHPWALRFTAVCVARLRNVPLAVLLGQANANACALYDFPC